MCKRGPRRYRLSRAFTNYRLVDGVLPEGLIPPGPLLPEPVVAGRGGSYRVKSCASLS